MMRGISFMSLLDIGAGGHIYLFIRYGTLH